MDTRQGKYLSYMLRLWRGVSGEGPSWRASLEDPRTGERRGFADLKELFGFLTERTEQPEARASDSALRPRPSDD